MAVFTTFVTEPVKVMLLYEIGYFSAIGVENGIS